jgi:hypothetical protein
MLFFTSTKSAGLTQLLLVNGLAGSVYTTDVNRAFRVATDAKRLDRH